MLISNSVKSEDIIFSPAFHISSLVTKETAESGIFVLVTGESTPSALDALVCPS